MLEAGLVLSRFLHYGAVSILFGAALFPLYAIPSPAERSAGLGRSLGRTLFSAALLALLSGMLWFASTAANMTGDLSGAVDGDALWSVATATSFGAVWMTRLALGGVILGVTTIGWTSRSDRPGAILVVLAGALLASLAGVGHTQVQDGSARVIHMSADALHLLAAGAWLGALFPLFHLVSTAERPAADRALLRFSGVGQVAVATLIISGLINSWYLVGSFDLLSTPYGRLLLIKLCLFAAMLAFAALNRFWLVPALAGKSDIDEATALGTLRRHILCEQILGAFIILIVGVLGITEPASH
jgi:copper resistance protein D